MNEQRLAHVDPLIIGGVPRSGTSLLRRLCNNHPQMRITHEFGNYGFIGDPFPVYLAKTARRVLEINGRSRIIGKPGRRTTNNLNNIHAMTAHLFQLARIRGGRVTLSALVEEARRSAPEALVVGDKMPQYIFMMDRLVEVPGLKRLVIYRDCRDVTNSFLRMVRTRWRHRLWIRDKNTAAKIARWWVDAIEMMERHAEHLFVIRYEELVRNPEPELRRLAEWLGVERSGFRAADVSDSMIGKYRHGLTDRELDDILRVARPTLERLNYTLH